MPREPCYRLTGPEPEFIETGTVPDESTYTPGQLEERVEKKVKSLPDRFDAFFNDIELLDKGDYFDPEGWGSGWFELLDINEDEPLAEQFTYSRSEPITDRNTPATQFGRQLGGMMQKLMLRPRGVEMDEVRTELVWGFIQGVSREEYDVQFTTECTTKLEERAENEAKEYHEIKEKASDSLEQVVAPFNQENKRVLEVLEDQDIAPGECLPGGVLEEIKRDVGIKDVQATPLSAADSVDSVDEAITQERVQRVVKENRLIEKRQLIESLKDGQKRIEDEEWNEVAVVDVLKNIPREEPATTRTITEKVEAGTVNAIAKIGLYLAGKDDLGNDPWQGPPLLQLKTNERSFSEWEWVLEPFGKALVHYLPNTDLPRLYTDTEIHAYLNDIPDDVIEDAVDALLDHREGSDGLTEAE